MVSSYHQNLLSFVSNLQLMSKKLGVKKWCTDTLSILWACMLFLIVLSILNLIENIHTIRKIKVFQILVSNYIIVY